MLPPERPDRIQIVFDGHRLVANAGLILPVTLAHHLRAGEPVDRHVDLGRTPGRANAGDKMLTPVASALAGGDCIDDTDALRTGGTEQVLGAGAQGQGAVHAGDLPRAVSGGATRGGWIGWAGRCGPTPGTQGRVLATSR